jgi:uncharacterized DUF497 family protein
LDLEFDAERNAANRAKHGISLADAAKLEILAVLEEDRFDYGEPRYRAWGVIDGVYFALAFTIRGEKIRPISLRRAHAKEVKRYVTDQEER